MAIALDVVASSSGAATDVLTYSVNIADTDNRLLVVSACFEDTSSGLHISGVTYNGTAMTQLGSEVVFGGGRDVMGMYYALNPDTGAHDVTVSYSATMVGVNSGAIVLNSATQAAPILTTATGTSTTPVVAITVSTVNSWAVDAVANVTSGSDMTEDSGQTVRFDCNGAMRFKGSTRAPAVSTNMGWTIATDKSWAIMAAVVSPYSAPPAYTVGVMTPSSHYWGGV